jgi:predicted ATPase
VGREHELAVLRDIFASALATSSTQLVTIVGVPGIGKSRLVHEFLKTIERDGPPVTWLQGRSLPYGAGVTLWALGEVVKAQARILESDGEVEAEEKLRRAVTDALGKTKEADWVHGHLWPLIAPPSDGEIRGDRRAESFAAWRRFMEALAGQFLSFSSWRTCIGLTTRSSTSSSTWSSGRGKRPYSCSLRRDPSCSIGGRHGLRRSRP